MHFCILNIYSHIAACMCKCQGHRIGHNNDSWIRVEARQESAGDLKVKGTRLDCKGCRFESCPVLNLFLLLNCSKRK